MSAKIVNYDFQKGAAMLSVRAYALSVLTVFVSIGVLLAVNAVTAQDGPGKSAAEGQATEPPLSDARLTVHTLLREDIFAGFLEGDMKRFAKGEKNIDLLMEKRPAQKANLLAWKGGAALFRAALANEKHRDGECRRKYQEAVDLLSEAGKLTTGNDGVNAVTGGSYALFADRLPQEYRAAAWKQAYDAYRAIWKQQGSLIQGMPVHFRGEVLGGLALTAERTGHSRESAEYIDKMIAMLHDTPYEEAARKWKADPKAASSAGINCMSCHDTGRLSARLVALGKK